MADVRRHKIGWKERYRYRGEWKKTQNWMEREIQDERRNNSGWKKTQPRMKGDTVVDGRRHNIGWKEIQWWIEEDIT